MYSSEEKEPITSIYSSEEKENNTALAQLHANFAWVMEVLLHSLFNSLRTNIFVIGSIFLSEQTI